MNTVKSAHISTYGNQLSDNIIPSKNCQMLKLTSADSSHSHSPRTALDYAQMLTRNDKKESQIKKIMPKQNDQEQIKFIKIGRFKIEKADE
ncbi:MAG: hypothetical protein GY874_16895 [Desulfobacteraceae bacterium]|nr:hypothetical protein [Desulfobacteraceae bacterium]